MRAHLLLLAGVAVASLAGSPSMALEDTVYPNGALCRLISATRTGGPSNYVTMTTCFDPAGSRVHYNVNVIGTAACGASAALPTLVLAPTPPVDGKVGLDRLDRSA